MINDDFALIEVLTGYQRAAVVTAACRLRLFDSLREARTAADLAAELGVDPGNLGALLTALAGIGLVTEHDDAFAATSYATARLGGGREMAFVAAKEAVFAGAWLHLDEVVTTGRPTMEAWPSRLKTHPSQAREFLEALDVLARISGPPVADFAELAPGRRVIDVGGGLGTYARKLQEAGSTVTLVDLPLVAGWAEEVLAGTGVECVGADLFAVDACGVKPESMDAAIVSHMLHDLPPDQCVALLRRVGDALTAGGHAVVNDFAGDLGPGDFGPLFDVMMRVETPGAAHSRAALSGMLESAGFTNVTPAELPEPLTVLIGRKP